MRAIYCLITLCILSFHETTALQAGEIFGTVTDATGLGTPGVKVTVTSTRGNATWDSTTNSQGRYAFQGIEPGEYNVSVQHPGFAVQKKNNIPVRDQERAHADFTLGVKELTETIDVSDMITVICTVSDKNGRFITGLGKEDFQLKEDGKAQQLANVSREMSLPLTVAILIDASLSVNPVLSLEKRTAKEFLQSVLREEDLALVMGFDRNTTIPLELTSDMAQLERAVDSIGVGQGTSLHDAIYAVCAEKLMNQGGRKVIVLISDGEDTTSLMKLGNALEAVRRADAIVYSISNRFSSGGTSAGDRVLNRYAEETGGRAFLSADVQELRSAFDAIQQELRGQYGLNYDSFNTAQDGSYRKLKVALTKHPEFKVRTKKGYFAPKSPSFRTVSKGD